MVKFFRFHTEHIVNFILQPWQFCFMILASWVHREQQKINEFYRAELEALMKVQGKKRILLTDDQRRLLAVKGKSLGRKALMELTTIVTPWGQKTPPNRNYVAGRGLRDDQNGWFS